MSCVKLNTVSFDFKRLQDVQPHSRKKGEFTEKKPARQVVSLPRNLNELVTGRLEKERSKNHKKYEEATRDVKGSISSCLLKLSNPHGSYHGPNFPPPVPTNKEVREAVERMKTTYRMPQQRSFSAPNDSSVKRRTGRRKLTRFPLLAPAPSDVTTRDSCLEKLMVVGRKVSETPQEAPQADEISTATEKPEEGGGSFEKEEEHNVESNFVVQISFHDNCINFHDDHKLGVYGNRTSEFPPDVSKGFKPLYYESSVSFDAYLRSRFGRSVFARGGELTESLGKNRRFSLDWAPLIIKKQDLRRRHNGAAPENADQI